MCGGSGGGGENEGKVFSVSSIAAKDWGESQGGGRMLARRWRLRRRASQSGSGVRWGGFSGEVEPCWINVNWRSSKIGLM